MSLQPLRVVHLITELNTGGAEQMLCKVATRMNRTRFRCVVVSMSDRGTLGEKISEHGIPVFHLGMAPGRPGVGGLLKLCSLLRKGRAHILQTWLYHADLAGILAGKMTGVPRVIWGIRCSDMDLKNYRFLSTLTVRLGAFLSPLADAIVVNSEEGKKVHQGMGYHARRMCVIPNGFDTRSFHPDPEARDGLRRELGLDREAFLIGLVARFDPKLDSSTNTLVINGLWLETAALAEDAQFVAALARGLLRFRRFVNARTIDLAAINTRKAEAKLAKTLKARLA